MSSDVADKSSGRRLDTRKIRPFGAFWSSPLLRRTLIAGVLALSLIKVFTYSDYLRHPYLTENDLSWDYVSAREWIEGGNPYGLLGPMFERYIGQVDVVHHLEPNQRNAHPPAIILFTAPLALFDFTSARFVWLIAMLIATYLAVYLFARSLRFEARASAAIGLVALTLPVVSYDLRWAQINGLILLGLVIAWRRLRTGRERSAGAILGIVAALKIFPWLLLIPVIRMGRRTAAGWFVATAAVVSIGSALVLGMGSIRDFLQASSDNQDIWASAPHSISLVTAPFRWIVPANWNDPNLPVPLVVPILAAVAFAVCVAAAIRTRAATTDDLFWATIPLVILASPIAWPHYLVLMLPIPLLVYARRRMLSAARVKVVAVALVLVVMGLTPAVWIGTGLGIMRNLEFQLAMVAVLTLAVIVVGASEVFRNHSAASARANPDG